MQIKKMLFAIWELPQNIVGWIVMKVFKAKYRSTYRDVGLYYWDIDGGMSLGRYIFLPKKGADMSFLHHEYGHTIQSKYLGWLYLLVIGLPSLIWAWCFEEYRRKTNTSYSWFYTERWADKLGGVQAED
jgi:hypothetical protein